MQVTAKDPGKLELKLRDVAIVIGDDIVIGTYPLTGPGEYEVGGVMAEITESIARLFAEDLTIGILRTPKEKLTNKELEELGAVDVFVVPIGEGGLSPKEALGIMNQVEAPIMLPRAAASDDIETLCKSEVTCERQSGPFKLTKSALPTEGTRIIVFD